jgi:hypothetical protein
MTNRLSDLVSSAALYAAFRFGLLRVRRIAPAAPDIRVRPQVDALDEDTWLFGETRPAFAAETFQLDQAMSRAAGSLASLRSVLSRLSKHALVLSAETSPSMPVDMAYWPQEDADLFDEAPGFFPHAAQIDQGARTVY